MKDPVVQQPARPEPYTCPELVAYGDIRQITQDKNCSGQFTDNAAGCQNTTRKTA